MIVLSGVVAYLKEGIQTIQIRTESTMGQYQKLLCCTHLHTVCRLGGKAAETYEALSAVTKVWLCWPCQMQQSMACLQSCSTTQRCLHSSVRIQSTILVLGSQPRKCSGWYSLWSPSCVLRIQRWTQTLGCHMLQNSVGVNGTSRQDGASRERRKGD